MPILTISRGTFSGGKELAECVAGELGYECVSREIISEAAERYGVSPAALAAAIDKPPSLLSHLDRARDQYLAYIRVALCTHALQDKLVYHGHGGHFLLRGIPNLVCVRVVADMEYRIQAAFSQLYCSRSKAISYIHKVDKEREKWTKFLYGEVWADPAHYDIVVNLQRVSMAGACRLVCQMAALEEFSTTPDAVSELEDLYLSSRVQAALLQDSRTSSARFQIKVKEGAVTIEGVAKLQEAIDAVLSILEPIEGIKQLKNEMVIGTFHGI